MLTLATVIAVSFAFLFPAVMGFNPFDLHAQIRPYIQPRALVTRDLVLPRSPNQAVPTETIGFLGIPLAVTQTPSPTLAQQGKVGAALQQTQTPGASLHATAGVHGTTVVQAGKVAEPSGQVTFFTSIALPTNTAHATTSSTATSTGVVGSPVSSSSNFFTKHSITSGLPNWAVLLVIIGSSIIFLVLVGLIVWQVLKNRKGRKNMKDADEEDILETYTKYWKSKRNSGGIVGQESMFSPIDEKIGRRGYM